MRHSQRSMLQIFFRIFVFLLLTLAMPGCKDEHTFRYGTTKPNSFGNSFLVIGDSRSGDRIYQDMIASITGSLSFAKCLLNVGDMIEEPGNEGQWTRFLRMTAPLNPIMPWYAVAGNHDVRSIESQEMYQRIIGSPSDRLYYSFDLLNSHFIVLDTEIPDQKAAIVGEQLAWLKQDLAASAASAQYLFVFLHRPVFPQGHYLGHNLVNAEELHQLFIQYGVDVVFAGHEHQYYLYQKDSIPYVVTGGGGAPIYDGGMGEGFHHLLLVELLPPKNVLIHVLDVNGNVIRTDTITSR